MDGTEEGLLFRKDVIGYLVLDLLKGDSFIGDQLKHPDKKFIDLLAEDLLYSDKCF